MRSSHVHERTDFVLLLWLVVVLVMLELRCWVFKRYAQDRRVFKRFSRFSRAELLGA